MIDTQSQFLLTGRMRFILILLLPTLLVFLIIQPMTVFGLDETSSEAPATLPTFNFSDEEIPMEPTGIITGESKIYLPISFKGVPAPTLLSVGIPTSSDAYVNYSMLVSWQDLNDPSLTYQLQESTDLSFSNPTVYDAGTAASFNTNRLATTDYHFYYRVRAFHAGNNLYSGWSNVLAGYGVYRDDFQNPASGWDTRREDTDDTDNSLSYINGNLKLKVGGRWDSMIASPLVPSPDWPQYRINTYVILGDGIDNLHSYGIVFGGDWDGVTPCPDSTNLSCFNRYYRLNLIWHGSPNSLKASLKRIDAHYPETNSDTNVTLMGYTDVSVDPDGWNKWTADVYADGTIKLYANGNLFFQGKDESYVGGGRYFGAFASADEYLGTAAYYDYYEVTPIPNP